MQNLRSTIRDKADNDALMQKLDIRLQGFRDFLSQLHQHNLLDQSPSSHPFVQEFKGDLDALDEPATYYCVECSEAWRYTNCGSFRDEFAKLGDNLDKSLQRVTGAIGAASGAKVEETKARLARDEAKLASGEASYTGEHFNAI